MWLSGFEEGSGGGFEPRIEDIVCTKKGVVKGGGEGFRGRFEPIIENIVKRSIKMGGRGEGCQGDGFEGKIEDIVQFKRRVVGGQGWGREGSGREGMDALNQQHSQF